MFRCQPRACAPDLIPQAYIDRVLAPALEDVDDLPTITWVTFEGQDEPAVVSLSRTWKGRHERAAPTPAPEATLPCRAVHSTAGGGMELLQCIVCDRLFTAVIRYSERACRAVVPCTPLTLVSAHCLWSVPTPPGTGGGPSCDRSSPWAGAPRSLAQGGPGRDYGAADHPVVLKRVWRVAARPSAVPPRPSSASVCSRTLQGISSTRTMRPCRQRPASSVSLALCLRSAVLLCTCARGCVVSCGL
jgi:hypothetical protein